MGTICGANCENCGLKDECKGCCETGGSPFGGRCVAAEYIKLGGKAAYEEFKSSLLSEINGLCENIGIPKADALFELCGRFVNLKYPLPNGENIAFLKDENVYLGTQIEFADRGVCYGVVADAAFILIGSYSVDGSEPEIVLYKKR